MYARSHPVRHFTIAIALALLAGVLTAAGPLLVLRTLYGVPPAVALDLGTAAGQEV
jgi:hypothetical protein